MGWFIAIFVGLLLVALPVEWLIGHATSETRARHAVTNQGFTHVHKIGAHYVFAPLYGCSDQDAAQYIYRATNPAGKVVTVKVCMGWPFKGATIRY
jgi:hypothetical protein